MEASQAIDLDRERSVGEILRVSLTVYKRYPLLFATLALGVIAPYEVARLVATGAGPFGDGGGASVGSLWLFQLIYYVIVGPLISALHVHAVVDIGQGKEPTLGSVAVRGFHVLAVVAAAQIVAGILIALGFLALIVPGVLLSLRWAVVAQTAAVEDEGWLPALRRSRELTSGHYGHIFGLLFVIGLLTVATGLVSGAVTAGDSAGVLSVVFGIFVYTIIASFSALTLAILYFDLRARKAGPAPSSMHEYQHLSDLD